MKTLTYEIRIFNNSDIQKGLSLFGCNLINDNNNYKDLSIAVLVLENNEYKTEFTLKEFYKLLSFSPNRVKIELKSDYKITERYGFTPIAELEILEKDQFNRSIDIGGVGLKNKTLDLIIKPKKLTVIKLNVESYAINSLK